jgi:pimeloyl-ACP methyl ester carboxylesterase
VPVRRGGIVRAAQDGYASPDAAVAGDGRFGVVFVNDSNNDACAWQALAGALIARGFVVAVFDGPSASYQVDQALSVAAALRRRAGVRRVTVIGASEGARAALLLGAEHPRAAVGLVALSAERRINRGGDLLSVGRSVRVPVLSVGSRRDPLTSFGRDTSVWNRSIERTGRVLRRTVLAAAPVALRCLFTAGVRDHLLAGRHGAPQLIENRAARPGLIVSTIAWAFGAYLGNVLYDTAKGRDGAHGFGMPEDMHAHRRRQSTDRDHE